MCGLPAPASNVPFRAVPTDPGFDVESLREDVHLLRARSTAWPSSGNIVVIVDGDGVALIDCGFGTEQARAELAASLEGLGRSIDAVHTVLVTHPHLDHAGGIGLLPGDVRVLGPAGLGAVVADARATAEMIFPEAARALAPERAGLDLVEHFRTDCGVASAPVATEAIEAGDVIRLGRTRWEAISTPGHEDGMFSYFEPELGLLACSDVLAAKGTAIPWYAPGGGGTAAYLAGLDRLAGTEIEVGVRGHGDLIHGRGAVAEVVAKTAQRITRRDVVVREALAAGPLSFADLEDRIYRRRVYEVIPWAASVLATHLIEGLENGTLRHADGLFEVAGGVGARS